MLAPECGARETADLTKATEDLSDLEAADLMERGGDPVTCRGDCNCFRSTALVTFGQWN